MIELNIFWFIIIVVLFAGFYILEGFDFGVGMLVPFLGKSDSERRMLINSIGPFWDGNEVWLITAGGAMFAAFPHWYASLFSAFYLVFLVVLVGLILRGISIEFRSKVSNQNWRRSWDLLLALGSFLPSFLIGLTLANMFRGISINNEMQYVGSIRELFNPYAILVGFASTMLCLLQGVSFLSLKIDGHLHARIVSKLYVIRFVAFIAVLAIFVLDGAFVDKSIIHSVFRVALIAMLFFGSWLIKRQKYKTFFLTTSLAMAIFPAMFFSGMFPKVLISSLNNFWSLNIYSAASSEYTLKIMSIIAVCVVPIVILYQVWSYWIFRKRLTDKSELHY